VLVDANSKLQTSTSAAEIGGPAIAGLLIERITAPMAILIDALSFFISTFSFLVIRTPETPPQQNMMKRGLIAQIGEGFGIVLRDAYLRAMLIEAAMYNFFASAFGALFVLYATRDLGLSPAMLGLVFGAGSVGSLLGAVVSARLMHAIGLGRALISAVALACVPNLLIPLAGGETHVAATILSVAYVLLGLGLGVSQVYVWSLRQTLVPSNLLGRMNAAYRFFITGASPFGALLGGVLGGQIGLRPTLLLCAIGFIVALLTIAISPLRTLQRLPDELEHTK